MNISTKTTIYLREIVIILCNIKQIVGSLLHGCIEGFEFFYNLRIIPKTRVFKHAEKMQRKLIADIGLDMRFNGIVGKWRKVFPCKMPFNFVMFTGKITIVAELSLSH